MSEQESSLRFGEGSETQNGNKEAEKSVKSIKVEDKMTAPGKRVGKRGRKPSKIDTKAKLERSRQSARECRARKKLRYQYLEELTASREKAIYALRQELEMYKSHSEDVDKGQIPKEIWDLMQRKQKYLDNKARAEAERASRASGRTQASTSTAAATVTSQAYTDMDHAAVD